MVKLSILDQSVACVGRPHGQTIRDTIALAQHCEQLGYERFWVSEHHSNETIVGTAPEVLLAAIGQATHSIRIGSAGVMLPHYSPLKVAEQFRVLDAIAPGRIDLGLGRAPGSDGRTAYALHPLANERPAMFPNDVRDLMCWVSGQELPEGHRFRPIKAYPAGDTVPEVWMLGSSDYGAQVAAHFGLPYAFAWFFADGGTGAQAMKIYQSYYKPSDRHPEPNSALCVFALCGDSEEEATYHFQPRARFRLQRDRGIFMPLESPDAALAYDYSEAEKHRMRELQDACFVGTAQSVRERIEALADELNIQEMAIVTWAYDEEVRHKSYRLLADAFDLKTRESQE